MDPQLERHIKPIKKVEFAIWSNDEILRNSAFGKDTNGVEVIELYNNLEPKDGGLLDARMGVIENQLICATCGLGMADCVGHFGHIKLAEPTFHFGYFKYIQKILSVICIRCSNILYNKNEADINEMCKTKFGKARLSELKNIVKNVTHCQTCGNPVSKIKLVMKDITIFAETNLTETKAVGLHEIEKKKLHRELTPENVWNIFVNISDADCSIMGLGKSRPESMIYKIFPVPPVAVRPSARVDFMASFVAQDGLTHQLSNIVKNNLRIKKNNETPEHTTKNDRGYSHLLQLHTTQYFDNESTAVPKAEQKGRPLKSLSARLKGKEGRLRGNLMGKRVDFSARTVITPDPCISINEFGVPLYVAMTESIPVTVTKQNVDKLQQLVNNGKSKYPGANTVIKMGRNMVQIDLRYRKQPVKLDIGDVVERHLVDGDVILINRQPTLHKQSMMSVHIRVINDSNLYTFRLSERDTKPFNADYDGDEMNAFIPQSIQSIVELQMISIIKNQLVNPRDSSLLIGSIQDTLLGGYNMTRDSVSLDWKIVMNLISYTSFSNFHKMKKDGKYSGKELFSFVLPKKINDKQIKDVTDADGKSSKKITFEIRNGQLLTGQIEKSKIGAQKKNNIAHMIIDEYGNERAMQFIDDSCRLICNFNIYNGFSIGLGDIMITEEMEKNITNVIATKFLEAEHKITEMENCPDMVDSDLFEKDLQSMLSVIREELGKSVMDRLDPLNAMKTLDGAGVKCPISNVAQMCACLASQEFEGKRMPKKISGRTLPYFFKDDDRAEARGFAKHSLLQGLNWPEYVFHHLASRLGLVETSIKTAETGYIQRKLIKSLEDMMVTYDQTVRSASGIVIQFYYGDNGIDNIRFIDNTIKILEMGDKELLEKYTFSPDELKGQSNKIYDDQNYYNYLIKSRDIMRNAIMKSKINTSTFGATCSLPVNLNRLIMNAINNDDFNKKSGKETKINADYILDRIEYILDSKNTRVCAMSNQDMDDSNSISKKDEMIAKTLFRVALHSYLAPKRCLIEYNFNKSHVDSIVDDILKSFRKAVVDPGEMVGIIAAQSIGEPTTQMSCVKETMIYLTGEKSYFGNIGSFIDDLLIRNSDRVSIVDDNHILELLPSESFYIIGVSGSGQTSWRRISHISKHPVGGSLIKITTENGRNTIATENHSFLKISDGQIIPIKGSQLEIGDFVPVAMNVRSNYSKINPTDVPMECVYDINKSLLPTFENGHIIGSQLKKYNFDPNLLLYDDIFIKGLLNGLTSILDKIVRANGEIKYVIDEPYKKLTDVLIMLYARLGHAVTVKNPTDTVDIIYVNDSECIAKKNDIILDKIINIEKITRDGEYVYDFTVPSNDSFMVDRGIIVHNTLNTFHFSGISAKSTASLGVPRIKELLSFSKNIKTPKMFVYLTSEFMSNKKIVHTIASHLKYVTIGQIKKGGEGIYYDPNPCEKGGLMDKDNVHNIFYSFSANKQSCQSDISQLPWLIRIVFDREKMLEREVTLLEIKSKFCNKWERKFADIKSMTKDEKSILENIIKCAVITNTDNDDQPIMHLRFDMASINLASVVKLSDIVVDSFKIKGLPGIFDIDGEIPEKVISFDNPNHELVKKDNIVIQTSGINLFDIRDINGVNANRTYCNDIATTLEIFGIEAARTLLIQQMLNVFSESGQNTNYCHVSVLADKMTNLGTITSIDRHGMGRQDSSPLARATFEKTVEQLITAAVHSEVDSMTCVSSRIMAGLAIKGGTGLCDIILDTNLIENSEVIKDETIDTQPVLEEVDYINDIINKNENIFVPE